jgi:hypothetical protein
MMPRRRHLPAVLGVVVLPLVLALGGAKEVQACGGCFIPPGEPTVVTGHRMAMTVSPTQSTLWDSIQYSGEPADFAWVLPVKPGARIEAANAAFFDVLEALTSTRIVAPYVDCGGGSSGGCFGATYAEDASYGGDGGDGAPTDGGGPAVEVVHHGTVGPYETVTLSTDTPGALNQWLADHGYNVDGTSQPIIDQYVAEGFDFIALRLQPGKGVQQMTPVRIVSEGSNVTLPLRMVSIGTGAETPIVLYVVGEGRYETQNFANVKVDTTLLSWDFKDDSSNYGQLWKATLAANEGKSFLSSFASSGLLVGPAGDPETGPMLFPQRYGLEAFRNGEATFLCQPAVDSFDDRVVHNPCPPGEPWHSPACTEVGADEIDARLLGCPGVDDVAVALEGLHMSSSWVTRLEANLPKAALVTDLTLQASAEQAYDDGTRLAEIGVRAEYACGSATPVVLKPGEAPRGPGGIAAVFGVALGAIGLAFAARRLRRVA